MQVNQVNFKYRTGYLKFMQHTWINKTKFYKICLDEIKLKPFKLHFWVLDVVFVED